MMQKEIDFCLKGLAMVDGGGLGRASSSRARVVGFKVARPKSKPRSKIIAFSKSARDSKGKGILDCPVDQPMEFRAKEGPGSRPPSTPAGSVPLHRAETLPGLDARISTPGASSSMWAPSLGPVAGIPSLVGQSHSPMRASTAPVPLGSVVSAARVNIPQSPVVGSPTPSSPGLVAGHLQGQSRLPERCFSPHSSSELQVDVEAVQLEELGQRREGELKAGSGAAVEKIFSVQEQLDSSELSVLCSEGGLVWVKDLALS
jgi:hypothetical protein